MWVKSEVDAAIYQWLGCRVMGRLDIFSCTLSSLSHPNPQIYWKCIMFTALGKEIL